MKKILTCLLLFLTTISIASAQYRVVDGQIFRQNERIHLMGVNWFGFESNIHIAHGLWARRYTDMIAQIKSLGFNAVRIPFGRETVSNVAIPSSAFNVSQNKELEGLGSLEVLDKIVEEFSRQEIHMLLDFHTIAGRDHVWDVWYDENSTEEDWIQALTVIADRYKDDPYVMGIDLKNEPHGIATWGTGNPVSDWKRASEAAAAAVLAVNDRALIFVEGIETNPVCSDNSDNVWWGGNLQPMACFPPNIPANRLVLSPHVYGPDVFAQPYFNAPNFPENMPAIWDTHFGFAKDDGYVIAPGEFGGKYGEGVASDVVWQNRMIDYFIDRKIFDFFYWSWNPNSGDTGGILENDWQQIDMDKFNNLKRLIDAARADLDTPVSNNPPVINITGPASDTRIEGPTTVEITVMASDRDGSVSEVEFLLDGTVIGSDTSAPYTFTTSSLAFGNYQLTARATDNEGARSTSSAVAITVFDPDAPVVPMGDLRVEYQEGGSQTNAQDIRAVLRIVNNGDTNIPLEDLTIRYWFTKDSNVGNTFNCDFAQVGSANVTGNFSDLSTALPTADTYAEIGFTSGAGVLNANSNSGQIQTRISKQNFENYDQSNDYSYDGSIDTFTETTRITLYRSGMLIAGVEPGTSADNMADTDNDGLPDSYEASFGLNIGENDAELDFDNDGLNNIEEYIAGTQPNNSQSYFRITELVPEDGNQTNVRWNSVSGRLYTLQGTNDLTKPFENINSSIMATPPNNSMSFPKVGDRQFFRVIVRQE